jgi:double-stranded uracil-DNA glycosylase
VRICSFEPIADTNAEVVVLGSMPGVASLRAQQYYAHPQNAFWRIIGELLGADANAPYRKRIRILKVARIAVWDVLASCVRVGSSDASIEDDSLIANDFRAFFGTHPRIRRVFFNGTKAEACYRRHVLPQLVDLPLVYFRLPSTSPANASVTFADKLDAWRAILLPRPSAGTRPPTSEHFSHDARNDQSPCH